jgi:hypothetical protein
MPNLHFDSLFENRFRKSIRHVTCGVVGTVNLVGFAGAGLPR